MAWAQTPSNLPSSLLKNANLHCGFTPKLDTIQDLEDNAREYNEDPMLGTRYGLGTLLLILHFEAESAQVPTDCQHKLEQLAVLTKQGKHSQLILRSSTQTNSSSELDLAMANQRLNAVYSKLRKQRVPRHTMLVELHARAVNPLLDEGLASPRLIEIYSKSIN
jgi:hypothetical protein